MLDQYGIFATTDIEEDTVVMNYAGTVHCTPVGESLPADIADSKYIFTLGNIGQHTVDIDARRTGNESRFINDPKGIPGAPKANCEFFVPTESKEEMHDNLGIFGVVFLKTKTKIASGSELLVDYGENFWEDVDSEEDDDDDGDVTDGSSRGDRQ